MALRIVNRSPGPVKSLVVPEQDVAFGVRSETRTARLGTLRVAMGFSNLRNKDRLPERDLTLTRDGLGVTVQTVERKRPVAGECARIFVDGAIRIAKTGDADPDAYASIYEMETEVEEGSSVLGHAKFRIDPSWSRMTPTWCNLPNIVCPYLAVELGHYNTGCFVFLRDAPPGAGCVVVGGPQQELSQARPGQRALDVQWSAEGVTALEVWVYFNLTGNPANHPPAPAPEPYVPIVEIWTRREGVDDDPILQAQIPVAQLGTFPAEATYNTREGASASARLFVGNAGSQQDVLFVEDWSLFPDMRVAVTEGQALSLHRLRVAPDAPVLYAAGEGDLPGDALSPWAPISGEGTVAPAGTLYRKAGLAAKPLYLRLPKSAAGVSGYEREEVRIERLAHPSDDGALFEALLSAQSSDLQQPVKGAGLAIEDGGQLFQVVMVDTGAHRALGVRRAITSSGSLESYWVSDEAVDWETLRLVRLVVDRRRGKVYLSADERRLSFDGSPSIPLASLPLQESLVGKIKFGHLLPAAETCTAQFSRMLYLPRYLALEAEDRKLPDAPEVAVPFVRSSSGTTSTIFDLGTGEDYYGNPLPRDMFLLSKQSVNTPGSQLYFSREDQFDDRGGFLVDFCAQVDSYTGPNGRLFCPKTWTGAGLEIFLGGSRILLGLFDCGIYGRMVGVVPGSGTVNDILNQTDLGRRFSARVDWTKPTVYRLIYRAGVGLEIRTGTPLSEPIITIPWESSVSRCDFIRDARAVETLPAIAFGHFDPSTASTTGWRYLRWGCSNGFDAAVRQSYAKKASSYLFGGKALIMAEISE